MNEPIRVLCVDDHSFLIDGLQARFELERDVKLVGALPNAEKLAEAVKEQRPDIVLLDIEMPGPDPFEMADDLRRRFAKTKIVFLSAYVRDHYISAAIKAGAWGYFAKADEPETLIDGIRRVARGEFAFSPKVKDRCRPAKGAKRGQMAPPSTKLDALSEREQEVLRMIGRGMSRSEIAETLCRSPKTVDGHRESIMAKLDIHDRAELVRFAIREGLVEV